MATAFLYILGGILILVIFLTIIAPKSYIVSRSIQVKKPLPEVFEYLKYLKNQQEWSPWSKKDPYMENKILGVDGKVGAISYWKGNKEVGEGEQEIVAINENESVLTELRFFKPFKSTSKGFIKVEKVLPDVTTIVWGFSGDYKFPMNILMIFMNMDKTVGKDFEQGLQDLKRNLESDF
ncbi:SRPBCC family protein [Galbibacter sp. BG1]|uniref:SRPBCC family protein n=1 Tax=Galbibacter sp. BG1 TaxID=1170699 RepID=UPI0015BF016C|nr:SRPBCC family protein [Galbibacter sp. BG1]QLE01922.1 SRPBCC family protein [Galbibacter sp. BG1]